MQEISDSIWGHIDDLRQTFLRTAWIVGIGFLGVLSFYQPIIQFFTAVPFESESGMVKQKVERLQVVNRSDKNQNFELPEGSTVISSAVPEPQRGGAPHYRIGPGETLFYERVIDSPLLIMGPIEGLTLVFKACFWLSIALTAPVWGWVWLQFICLGSKPKNALY